jgi:hypothetical protein
MFVRQPARNFSVSGTNSWWYWKTPPSISLAGRAELLGRVRELTAKYAREWVDAAISYKRLDPRTALVGEEWISGPSRCCAATAGRLSDPSAACK